MIIWSVNFSRWEKRTKIDFGVLLCDKICSPKLSGGLGLRRFEDINVALLCKIGWWLVAGLDTLWSKALKAKYFPHSVNLKCKKKNSHPWH